MRIRQPTNSMGTLKGICIFLIVLVCSQPFTDGGNTLAILQVIAQSFLRLIGLDS